MQDYLNEIEHAATNVIETIWDEQRRFHTLTAIDPTGQSYPAERTIAP